MTSERRRQRRQPPTRNVVHGSRRYLRRRERTAAACCYFATRRVGNPLQTTSATPSSSYAYLRYEANSLPQPHAVTIPAISSLLPSASVISFPFVPPSPSPSQSRPLSRLIRYVRNPPVHHRRHYPTTGFPSTDTPLEPLTLRGAPSRARYQPAAIPTATTESRDRPRVVGSPPVSYPTRRHATPRAACVSLHRVSKACEREKPYHAFLVP